MMRESKVCFDLHENVKKRPSISGKWSLIFAVLQFTWERGEMRFSEAVRIFWRYGLRSPKTVNSWLKKIVEWGLLDRFISKKTNRPAYRLTPEGTKLLAFWQASNLMKSLFDRLAEERMLDSSGNPLNEIASFHNGLLAAFVSFNLLYMKSGETEKQQIEQYINLYTDVMADIDKKMLKERIKKLLKMDNYEEICKEWLKQEICPYLMQLKESKSHRIPEMQWAILQLQKICN